MKNRRNRGVFFGVLVWLAGTLGLSAIANAGEIRDFVIAGTSRALSEGPPEVEVVYRAMRFNELSEQWNVDVLVTNKGTQTFSGIIVLAVDSFSGTTGPIRPDGFSIGNSSAPFYQLQIPSYYTDGTLGPKGSTQARTIALGFLEGTAAPRLVSKVFLQPAGEAFALALTRTLDGLGQPLPRATISETGPRGPRVLFSDSEYGIVTLGQGPGDHVWRFDFPGHLPVWRAGSVPLGNVRLIANPRLAKRDTNLVSLAAGAGSQFADAKTNIHIAVPAGAFSQTTEAALTPIDGQTLPGWLPQGWSPLSAFWLELSREPAQNLSASLRVAGALALPGVLARWDTNRLQWIALRLVAANGTNQVSTVLNGSGAYAFVVPDTGVLAPPGPTLNQPLPRSNSSSPGVATLSASGAVDPPSGEASPIGEEVTAVATLRVATTTTPAPSGFILRGDVREDYVLQDGSRRFTSSYDQFIASYQQPGDNEQRTLHATFPIRPLLLFGGEELAEGKVTVDILPQGAFSGGVLQPSGNFIESDAIRLSARPGTFDREQAALIRRLQPTNFAMLVTAGTVIEAAFDLTIAATLPGQSLAFQVSNLPTNQDFVLSRLISNTRLVGLEPVERLLSDANRSLTSVEPPTGERLPGITRAGQYLLLRVSGPRAVLRGFVRGEDNQPVANAEVRITGQPWVSVSDSNGVYKLVAPTGSVQVAAMNPVDGQTDFLDLSVANAQTISADLALGNHGPRISSVSPPAGARNVPRVTPIVVTFSEPINPGVLVNQGIQLLGTNGQPVAASLSLNVRNTTATLLPTDPLAAGQLFTIALSNTIADLSGRTLEGSNQFTFQTQRETARTAVAQLTSREPVNGVATLEGSQGSADPESPVILINETTGATATVLSKPDGSFSGSIEAAVDDFLRAVLVNQNGTRTLLPVTRQVLADGRIGLFRSGGILEAQSDGGPVQVLIEPGAIPEKTTFKLDPVSLTSVLEAVQNTQPASGKVLGGFRYHVDGDGLRVPPQVKFPVDPATLDLPPNVAPEEAGFALTAPRQVAGETVYILLDRMVYKDGFLVTDGSLSGLQGNVESASTEPLPQTVLLASRKAARQIATLDGGAVQMATTADDQGGELIVPIKAASGNLVRIEGNVFSGVFTNTGEVIEASKRTVPGALVFAIPEGLALHTKAGELFPGALVAEASPNGSFRMLHPAGALSPSGNSFSLLAASALFPLQYGFGSATREPSRDAAVSHGDVIFDRGIAFNPAVFTDVTAPVLSAAHTPAFPDLGATCLLQVLATDDKTHPTFHVDKQSVQALDPLIPVVDSDVTVTPQTPEALGGQVSRQAFQIVGTRPSLVTLKITATDANLNSGSILYPLEIGGPNSNIPPPTGGDTNGPFVLSTIPAQGAQAVPPGTALQFTFNEPLDPSILSSPVGLLTITPDAGLRSARLSDDHRTLIVVFYQLKPSQPYSVTLAPSIRDSFGNVHDQDPSTPMIDAFTLTFRMAELQQSDLPGIESGGGIVSRNRFLYVLERNRGLKGALVVFDATDSANVQRKTEVTLDGYPRDIVLIASYSFRLHPGEPVQTRDLLAVVGGNLGVSAEGTAEASGQYLKIFDISDPVNPKVIAATLASPGGTAAITKLAWSPPILGLLEAEADTTAISLVNLQLFIHAHNLTPALLALEPELGSSGLDLNGDGDFVDPDEELPRVERDKPRSGLLNGGLVAAYTLRDQTTQQLTDFSMQLGGRLIGVVATRGVALDLNGRPTSQNIDPAYITLVSGGARLNPQSSSFPLPYLPKRVATLLGARITVNAQPKLANLAFVSPEAAPAGQPNKLTVIDFTDPAAPTQLTEISIPPEHGVLQSVVQRGDGVLLLATTSDLLLLDPTQLGASGTVPTGLVHPALMGVLSGQGGGARSFVGSPDGFYAIAFGGRNRVLVLPGRVDIVAHKPGMRSSPGRVIPEALESNPSNLIVAINNDDDDGILPEGDDPLDRVDKDHADSDDTYADAEDNDLIDLTLKRLPAAADGTTRGTVQLEVHYNADFPSVRLSDDRGNPLPSAPSSAGQLLFTTDLTAGTGPFKALGSNDVDIFLEGIIPDEDVRVKLTYKNADGQVVGTDELHLATVKIRIVSVWSDQFPDRRLNRLPDLKGNNDYPFLLMATRADGKTYIKASFQVDPDITAIKEQVQIRLVPMPAGGSGDILKTLGTSSVDISPAESVASIVSPDYQGVEYFIVAGLDYNEDGKLSAKEITTVYGAQPDRPYVAGDKIIFTRTPSDDNDSRLRTRDYHIKVIDQAAYDHQQLKYSTLGDFASFARNSFAPHLLHAFATGLPLQAPLAFPQIGSGPAPVGTPEVIEPNHLSYTHNVGVTWDTDGKARIPHYVLDSSTSLPDKILESVSFTNKIAELIAEQSGQIINAFNSSTATATRTFDFHFINTVAFGSGIDCVAEGFNQMAQVSVESFASKMAILLGFCPEFDLFVGIGTGTIDVQVTVTFQASPFPVQEDTVFQQVGDVHVQGKVYDFYDWNYAQFWPDDDLATIEAGFGTLGIGGKVFSYEIPLDGNISPLNIVVSP